MASTLEVNPAVTVTPGAGDPPTPYYEAVWHEPLGPGKSKPAKQRIGKAWLDFAGRDERGRALWGKRKGRAPEGFYDERRATAAAPDAVLRWRERQTARAHVPTPTETVTVRELAHEWFAWLRDVKTAAPSTLQDYGYMLREPGAPAKRGPKKSPGRLMLRFGDVRVIEVTPKAVSLWLRDLDGELAPKNVNKHRDLLHAICAYGQRLDTYNLPANAVAPTDKRREPPPAHVEYYERTQVEALARAAEQRPHRKPRGRKSPDHRGPLAPSPLSARQQAAQLEEAQLRHDEDQRDAELFRVLFYTGMRLGEIRALRWRDVTFDPDMNGAMFQIRTAFSAGQEKPPKSWRARTVAAPRPAAEALARLSQRSRFPGPDDFVFCGRRGQVLSDSAIRRRYTAARDAAGLHPVNLHGLRHAAGSILAQGIDQVYAASILGHARVSTTDRYTHGKVNARSIAATNAAYGVRDAPASGGDRMNDAR
jgi:integrase